MCLLILFIFGRGDCVCMRFENEFQPRVIRDLEMIFPDVDNRLILKNDSGYIQGIPDLLILYKDRWAMLECKRSIFEPYQPNQEYYLEMADRMSFGAMICPENRREILDELQRTLAPRRKTRIPKSV